jgi:hypothetical protein
MEWNDISAIMSRLYHEQFLSCKSEKNTKGMLELDKVIHSEPPRYRAFMLRCWEVRGPEPGDPVTWRFSVEDSLSGQRHGFADMEALTDFLQAELERSEST